jgi:hypothetical protein
MLGDQHIEEGSIIRTQVAALYQDLAEGSRLLGGEPAIEAVQQGVTVDEVVLEGQQPEEEVAIA